MKTKWLVSGDGIEYRVYRRAGLWYRILRGRPWRCVSGRETFEDIRAAWDWIEWYAVNRVMPWADWHSVGYARWMRSQHPRYSEYTEWPDDPWFSNYTTEPPWVYQMYKDGPPA